MTLDSVLFYVLAALILASSILTITRRNVVYAAVWLVNTLVGVAGIFLLRGAEFLAGVQVIVYIGGIMVLFLFVIMLVSGHDEAVQRRFSNQKWPALAGAVAVCGMLSVIVLRGVGSLDHPGMPEAPPIGSITENSQQVGQVLFSQYLLPFELASILLLVAIIGAIVMSKTRNRATES
ncbi:MAG: NADH-quinone oxidoreductase subunit J [Bryobacterales bacterium]|nr:NADH-quinone oxidoreductase subunit J [Bryobacterales bacterium]